MWSTHKLIALCIVSAFVHVNGQCPQDDIDLVEWAPAADDQFDAILDGQKYLLTGNLRYRSLTIRNGGKLVVSDSHGALRLEFKYLLIHSDGEFHAGGPSCRFQNELDIMLYGRSDDTDVSNNPVFGRKFIGIAPTGTISLHGQHKQSWTVLTSTLTAGTSNAIIDLKDDATNWSEGDRVVIASSSYDMNEAEEFTLSNCAQCTGRQVRLTGSPSYTHFGEVTAQGVDLRVEVGLLSRNIRIYSELQPTCYGDDNYCQYFNYDTFGGHVMIVPDFKRADFEAVEIYNMGQQRLGRYPIHYHVIGKIYGTYVKHVSIHNCFNRCVTVHGAEGLLIQDVVGYDTLGHCFFLEDGNEQNNQLIRNLGLVTKYSTVLPSDRSKEMCEGLLDNVYPGYVPDAEQECMEVGTFWISHPNNTIRNNSAAGSVNNGFHYVFHREPTGPSKDTLAAYHGERSHIPLFAGNRAHSNIDVGLLLDRGVKITSTSQEAPAQFLSMQDYARYTPHENQDLLAPRWGSHFIENIIYKNNIGARIRGGDVYIDNCAFSDNDYGVQFISDPMLPDDAGSHQEVTGSTIVGTTDWNNAEWQARPYPAVGVQLMSGPVSIDNNYFYGYTAAGGREAYAIGFVPLWEGQFSAKSTFGSSSADEVPLRVYMGRDDPNSIYGSYDKDGDKFQIFYDSVGHLTGYTGSYVMRRDNHFMRGSNCYENYDANAAVCIGDTYGQLFVDAQTKTMNMTIQRMEPIHHPVMLYGAKKKKVPTATLR